MNTLIERVSVLNSSSVTNYEHEQIDNLIDNKNLFGKTEMESYNNEDSHINKFNYLHNNDVTIYFLKNIKYSLYSNIKEINKYGLTNDETIKFKKSIVSLLSNI
ncbi:hypothetical protein FG379_001634 [Cryptosporidium bovis]|uniref:uncharacterized protein n=1 Tax=Cryptosporidium bovis TaxID=310047 RepID=UPI00351A6671|nr:hypothetical protein FG379_001634 [Cryptosporidium bovis]